MLLMEEVEMLRRTPLFCKLPPAKLKLSPSPPTESNTTKARFSSARAMPVTPPTWC